MKKKFIPVLAAAALVGLGSLAACQGGGETSSQPSTPDSSHVTPTPTPSSEDATVKVTGVTLSLAKTTIKVGETTKATIEVAPANATNKA